MEGHKGPGFNDVSRLYWYQYSSDSEISRVGTNQALHSVKLKATASQKLPLQSIKIDDAKRENVYGFESTQVLELSLFPRWMLIGSR
jgi:hypothetical protein